MYRWISFPVLLVTLAACADAPNGEADAAGADEETRRALESQLIEADRRFTHAVQRHGLGGWMENFAPTGRLVLDGQSHIGPEGIRRTMLPVFADTFAVDRDPTYAEIAASGELGYTVGRYERTWRTDGGAGEIDVESGTYLTVWRKQSSGSWKVQADIRSPDDGGG